MRILLADDHPLFREAVRQMLRNLDEVAEVFEARDYPGLFELARANRDADLALIDLYMPGAGDGLGVATFRGAFPDIPVVVLSAAEACGEVRRALDEGAAGFIPKSFPPELMLSAMRVVLAGGMFLPPQLLDGVDEPRPPAPARLADLTPRQADVLRLILRGLPNKSIARELGLAEGTVKVHLAAVFKALGAANRTEAVVAAQRLYPELAGSRGPG